MLHESKGARGRQNIHVTETHVGESSTWLRKGRQPQCCVQDKPFNSPHQRNARVLCQTTAVTPGDCKRRSREPTVQGYSLNICPFWSWHLHLTLISFCYWWPYTHTHTHKISLGHSTRVGQSVGSEGTRNKTLLCICQAVPSTLPSQPFSGHLSTRGGALLEQWNWTGGAASSLQHTPPKNEGQATNKKEVGLRVSPRGSEALTLHEVVARDQAGQSATALISAFYVLKMLHLHSHVFSCSLSSAECQRTAE